MTVTVEFIQFDAPYKPGDRKECAPGEAEKLIRSGVARRVPSRRQDSPQDEAVDQKPARVPKGRRRARRG